MFYQTIAVLAGNCNKVHTKLGGEGGRYERRHGTLSLAIPGGAKLSNRRLSARAHHAFAGVPGFSSPLPSLCSGCLSNGSAIPTAWAGRTRRHRFLTRLLDAAAHSGIGAVSGTATDREPRSTAAGI